MKRPFGITVIAILTMISGLFGLCWPTVAFTGGAFLGPFLGTVSVFAGIFLLIGPVLQLIFASGALKLRPWAWYMGLIASGITVVGVVINIFDGGSIWSAIWGSIVPIIVFIYLLTPNVRQAFGQAPEQPATMATPAPVEPPASDDNTQQ